MSFPSYLLSCDWGTSSFRLRLARRDPLRVERSVHTPEGADRIDAPPGPEREAAFRGILERHTAEITEDLSVDAAGIPIWISGMAGSSVGWRELPYAPLPFPLDGSGAVIADLGPLSRERPHPVRLVSGLRAERDVLRGEETQALGIFSGPAGERLLDRAVLILPGTHSKHIDVRGGAVTDFRTFMTGELFELLSKHSILRHAVSGLENPDALLRNAEDAAAFREGVREGAAEPLPKLLFRVRARALLEGLDSRRSALYLSGILIGSELAALRAEVEPGSRLLFAAEEPHATLYAAAAEELGLDDAIRVPADETALAAARGHFLLETAFRKRRIRS